jgi:hypothetical protein
MQTTDEASPEFYKPIFDYPTVVPYRTTYRTTPPSRCLRSSRTYITLYIDLHIHTGTSSSYHLIEFMAIGDPLIL